MNDDKRMMWVALSYSAVLLLLIAGISYLVWDKPDPRVMYVPVPILVWAFAGGMVGVLYQLAFRKGQAIRLYTWLIAKPVIGMVMGGIVYFLAVSGELALNGKTDISNMELLNVLAFLGGFSDRYSVDLLDRVDRRTGFAQSPVARWQSGQGR
jgi:peptidoglycan/LPS O-acetylase OafA/YrhL